MKEGSPCKWKSKESWSSNTHIRQKRLKQEEIAKQDKKGHCRMIKQKI